MNTYKLGYYPPFPTPGPHPISKYWRNAGPGEGGANGAKSVPDHLFYSEQIRNGVGNKCHLWLILIDGKLSKNIQDIKLRCLTQLFIIDEKNHRV